MAMQWSAALAVGDTVIDSQHKELINRLNALLAAMSEGKGSEEISKTLKFLEQRRVCEWLPGHIGKTDMELAKFLKTKTRAA